MVEFLAKLSTKSEGGIQLTIFKEPWLESGSPDLVGVFWHLPTAEKWNRHRSSLRRHDFRLLHQLACWGSADLTTIQEFFGKKSVASLERLDNASMISLHDSVVHVRAVDELYAVRHIFAIEAKIGDWRKALTQASLNRWFATSSHVLLPRLPSNANAAAEARSLGVNLWAPEATKLTLKPPLSYQPVSHASWQFNDEAWKHWMRSSSRYAESQYNFMDQ